MAALIEIAGRTTYSPNEPVGENTFNALDRHAVDKVERAFQGAEMRKNGGYPG